MAKGSRPRRIAGKTSKAEKTNRTKDVPGSGTEAVVAATLSKPVPGVPGGKPSSLVDTRVIYCGDCLEQVKNLPDACVEIQDSHEWHEAKPETGRLNRVFRLESEVCHGIRPSLHAIQDSHRFSSGHGARNRWLS